MLFLVGFTFGQRMVKGTVVDTDGVPLIGANVLVPGSTLGTITDFDGSFSLNVPSDVNTLEISYTGYEDQTIDIAGRDNVVITLSEGKLLDEVVVTALGISRDKKSLGYATQTVGGNEVSTVKQGNMINSLAGKVSGLQLKQTSNFGGSTNIQIRGNNSLLGNNQPLFVVDGVPVSNYQGNSSGQAAGGYGYDYGNAASDINADDVAEVSILKGAAATALYGSRGGNGVILITTKKGSAKKGLGISVTQSLTFGRIDKSTFIDYQDQYGAGYGKYYGPTEDAYFDQKDLDGDGTPDLIVPTYEDASYGGNFDPNNSVRQWESFVPESPLFGKSTPYVAAASTPVDFFETGVTSNTSNRVNFWKRQRKL